MVDLDELRRQIVLAVSQSKSPREFLRDRRLKELYDQIKSLPPVERGPFGKRINELKQAVEQAIAVRLEELEKVDLKPIDVTAPMDVNSPKPELLPSEQGTIHPLSTEIERISEIFNRMGFVTEESREIDDQFHMFESLNFPKGHPIWKKARLLPLSFLIAFSVTKIWTRATSIRFIKSRVCTFRVELMLAI